MSTHCWLGLDSGKLLFFWTTGDGSCSPRKMLFRALCCLAVSGRDLNSQLEAVGRDGSFPPCAEELLALVAFPASQPGFSFSSQFEYVSQHLVFANCIPLILKFFNQNIMSYITAKNRYSRVVHIPLPFFLGNADALLSAML